MNNTVGALVRKFRLEQNQTQLAFAELLVYVNATTANLKKARKPFYLNS